MTRVIGHGRYAGEVYPQGAPSAGGPPAGALVPLSRQRFIDGGTTQLGSTGAIDAPYPTIAAFMASRGDASVQDATANYVGWLMPALNGYTENFSFPHHVSTELRADSFSSATGLGTSITGTVRWDNVGPSGPVPVDLAFAVMHNVSLSGIVFITDDGGAPTTKFIFSGDEQYGSSVSLTEFDSTGATSLVSATFENATVLEIQAGAAGVIFTNSQSPGLISGSGLVATNSNFGNAGGTFIVTATDGPATFTNCQFAVGSTPFLTCPFGATFDGTSWRSFAEAGGSREVGTSILVVGGYSGGAVEGAALTDADVSVSLNGQGVGITPGFTGEHSGNHYTSTGITASRIVTLKTGGGELPGDTILISRTNNNSAFTLVIHNNANVLIATIPVSARGFVLAQFDGSDWVFAEGGSLIA